MVIYANDTRQTHDPQLYEDWDDTIRNVFETDKWMIRIRQDIQININN